MVRRAEPIRSSDYLQRAFLGSPAEAVEAATPIFRELGVPIARGDPDDGVLETAWFTVHGRWGEVFVTDRIFCGVDSGSGVPPAWNSPVTVRMILDADHRLGGSSVRLQVEAGVEGPVLRSPGVRESGCVPTHAFVEEIFASMGRTLDRAVR